MLRKINITNCARLSVCLCHPPVYALNVVWSPCIRARCNKNEALTQIIFYLHFLRFACDVCSVHCMLYDVRRTHIACICIRHHRQRIECIINALTSLFYGHNIVYYCVLVCWYLVRACAQGIINCVFSFSIVCLDGVDARERHHIA